MPPKRIKPEGQKPSVIENKIRMARVLVRAKHTDNIDDIRLVVKQSAKKEQVKTRS